MLELLLRFETLFSTLSMPILLGTGAGLFTTGILLWLFGQRFGAVIIGLLGAVVGTVLGLLVGQWLEFDLFLSMGIGALILTIASVLLRNSIILALTVAIFAMISGAGYISTQLDSLIQTSESDPSAPSIYGPELFKKSPAQSFSNMIDAEERLAYFDNLASSEESFSEKMRVLLHDTWEMISPQLWKVIGITLAGAAVGVLLIWLVKKVVILLAYSVVGSTTLLFGLQILLLGIGVRIVSKLPPNPWLLPSIFGGLVLVGWISQGFITKPAKGKAATAANDGEGDDYSDDGDAGGDD
ncbi:MAG: hypothetical protein GY809_12400 [Planctomycetes bacterium]|nr:hypothetical protein [Planctomycetota bacterium]